MSDDRTQPPRGEEMNRLLSESKQKVMTLVEVSQPSRRRRRTRIVGASVVGVIACGGVATAAAATGLFGTVVESTNTVTADVSLGPAPAAADYVEVSLDVACNRANKYTVDLDHARNPISVECDETDKSAQISYQFELLKESSTHTLTVGTKHPGRYTIRAFYRSGLTDSQRIDAQQAVKDKANTSERLKNATVPRTRKLPSTDPFNHPAAWPDPYYVNENGMTIGTFDPNTTPYDQWPDLRPQRAPNGKEAFVLTEEGSGVRNPDEAVAYMNRMHCSGRIDDQGNTWEVFFAKDGRTVVARRGSGRVQVDGDEVMKFPTADCGLGTASVVKR